HDRPDRVADPEVDHGVHLDRDVVPRDHVLRRDVESDDPQRDLDHSVDAEGDQEDQPRTLRALESAEPKDDAALVLPEYLQARPEESDQPYPDRDQHFDHWNLPQSASTITAIPCPPPMHALPSP